LVIAAAALFAVTASASAQTFSAQAFSVRELDRLRQQQKFDEAEDYCRQWLTRTAPTDPARAEIVVELIRSLSLQASSPSPGSDSAARRDSLWASARQAAADFLRSPQPRAALVRYQDALTLLAQGEIAGEENEIAPLAPKRLEQARQTLREASAALESLERELRREIPLRRRSPGRAGELSADELSNLADHALQQLARADQNRALLYDPESADRLALLLSAAEVLERLQTQVPAGQPLHPLVQLDLIECQRLLGKYQEATELAASLAKETQAPGIRSRTAAELLRLAVARGDAAAAARLLESSATLQTSTTPELALARLQGLLFLAQATTGEPAKQRQAEAAEAARRIEQSYGDYWGRRASQLIARSLAPGAAASVELLRRSADGYYLKKDYDRAIAAYDDSAAEAQKTGDPATAFELAYKAALVEQKRGAHAAAATRLRILARRQPDHPQAAAAHLLAVWNSAQFAGQAAKRDGEASATYAELLAEHLALWPAAETADQARLWLGTLYQSRADWPAAIAAYAAVARSSPHYGTAVAELASCWQSELAALASQGKQTAEPAQQAILQLRQAITGTEGRWTEADRTAALTAAALIVSYEPGRSAEAEELLHQAQANASDAPPAWQTAAQAQLVVAIAAQRGREKDALAELAKTGVAAPEELVKMLEALAQVAGHAPDEVRRSIAQVQLAALQKLSPENRSQLAPEQQLMLERTSAEALAALGHRDEALAAYAKLASEHPDSGAIQEDYARLLVASSDEDELRQALDRWRLIASRTRPHTPRWFEAKYSVALAQFRLGDRAGAARLLRFLLETPPGLAGTEWEIRYRELLSKCTGSEN
jgi:tetratricopeptide (TPR) repeat protein